MRFPEPAWCAAAVEHFNADPDAAAAAGGWSGDLGLVVEGVGGVYLGPPREGRLPAPAFCTVAELEARGPAYLARASAADWQALIEGTLDPIAAIVQKRLIAQGDLGQVVARLQYRGLAERWLTRIRTG